MRQRSTRIAPGQHFLRSSSLASELVRDAGVVPGELVVDVGAGSGALTRALVEAGARVTALERDPALAADLRRRFADVEVVEIDARRWPWPELPFSVVSNLPFAGSGEILERLLADPRRPLRRADVIVQWEFAAKHASVWPATMRATYWRAWFEIAVIRRLARSAFAPPPSVDAGVLAITRRPRPLVDVADGRRYRAFLNEGFRANAPVSRALRQQLTPRELRRLAALHGFDAEARARDLDARQWAAVFRFARGRSLQLRRGARA